MREALAIAGDRALPGARVVRVLDRGSAERGAPEAIGMEHGAERTGPAPEQ
jgi:hypothetical protein